MTVENQDNKKRVQGDGVTTPVPISFRVLSEADLKVYLVTRATSVAVLQTGGGVDYSVVLEEDGQGGVVTFTVAPPSTKDILIINLLEYTQPADLPTEGNFPEDAVETALDRCRLIDIQIKEEVNRCLKLKTEDVLNTTAYAGLFMTAEAIADRQDRVLVWNSAGTEIGAGPLTTDLETIAASIGAVEIVSANIASVITCATNIANINTVATNIVGVTNLAAFNALTGAADKLPYFTGANTMAVTSFTAFGRSLVDDADSTAGRVTLGVVIGTNVQAWDADLDTWATKTAPSGTVVGTTDSQTLTNKALNGTLGATTPAAATVTSLSVSGTAVFTGAIIGLGIGPSEVLAMQWLDGADLGSLQISATGFFYQAGLDTMEFSVANGFVVPVVTTDVLTITDPGDDFTFESNGTGGLNIKRGGQINAQIGQGAGSTMVSNILFGGAQEGDPVYFGINGTGVAAGVDLNIYSRGTGAVKLMTGSAGVTAFAARHTASGVNNLATASAATGNAPALSAEGANTDIDLALVPKGTGVVKFGTRSAIGAETVTGYITIKDAGGTTRKLAVVS